MPKIIARLYFLLAAVIFFNTPYLEATRMLPDPPTAWQAVSAYQ